MHECLCVLWEYSLKAFLQSLIDLIQSLWLRNFRWWVGLGGHGEHPAGSAGLPAETWSAEHWEVPATSTTSAQQTSSTDVLRPASSNCLSTNYMRLTSHSVTLPHATCSLYDQILLTLLWDIFHVIKFMLYFLFHFIVTHILHNQIIINEGEIVFWAKYQLCQFIEYAATTAQRRLWKSSLCNLFKLDVVSCFYERSWHWIMSFVI